MAERGTVPYVTDPLVTELLVTDVAFTEIEDELAGLRTAMATRAVIEQAKGMLMLQRHCQADEAFKVLVELSQTSHRKLHDVAEMLVSTWSIG